MNWYKLSQHRDNDEIDEDEAIKSLPEDYKFGDCYSVSANYVIDNYDNSNLRLAHGKVSGQGPVRGVRYNHAWIEDGDMVLDLSLGRRIELPKMVYYSIGNIQESEVKRYNSKEATKKMLEFKHYGPW